MRRQAAGAAGGKSVPVVSATTPPAAPKNQARFAKQVAARLTKAARMPHALPKEDIKVILRPRGGLNVACTEAPKLMEAIFEMAGTTLQESREDTICTNNAQNIIVISTPHEQRARMYSGIRLLRIAGREHEVSAYVPAPEGTVKGVIRGISLTYTEQDLQENIVNEANPLALEAHRMGNTTTVIVAFKGTKVPSTIKFGAIVTRCSLYKQHYEVCHCCGRLGHRADVCPYPDTEVCFACGVSNPGPTHERECKPRCKLCGGAHPTGVAGCKNRYKTPHVVKLRRWERKRTEEQQRRAPTLGLTDFPQLRAAGEGAKRIPQKHADVSGAAAAKATTATAGGAPAAAAGGGEASRRSGGGNGNQVKTSPREGVTWAAAMAEPRPRREANPQEPRSCAPQQVQPTPETMELRSENARLRAQLAQQDQKIAQQERQLQEFSKKLDMFLTNQQQHQAPALPSKATRRQAQRQVRFQEQEQEQEQMQTQEPERIHAVEPRTAELVEEGEETVQNRDSTTEEEDFSPRAKRRATVMNAIERRHQQLEDSHQHLEERMDRFERDIEAINRRLATVEATTADMSVRMANMERMLQQLLTRFNEITHQQQQPQQQQQPHQPQQPSKTRPTWQKQR